MKNRIFKKPEILGQIGSLKFVLFDGTETKSVYSVGEYDKKLGVYPILNKNNEVCEYMDLIGNFTSKPTTFAKYFNEYIDSEKRGVGYGDVRCFIYYTGLIDFPSRYLIDKKVSNIVKQEELKRYNLACKRKLFISLFDRLKYKIYVSNIYNRKVSKAKQYFKQLKANGLDVKSAIVVDDQISK